MCPPSPATRFARAAPFIRPPSMRCGPFPRACARKSRHTTCAQPSSLRAQWPRNFPTRSLNRTWQSGSISYIRNVPFRRTLLHGPWPSPSSSPKTWTSMKSYSGQRPRSTDCIDPASVPHPDCLGRCGWGRLGFKSVRILPPSCSKPVHNPVEEVYFSRANDQLMPPLHLIVEFF